MINKNKKYKTRSGKEVKILCTDRDFPLPVVGLINNSFLQMWTKEGKSSHTTGKVSSYDLVEVDPRDDLLQRAYWCLNYAIYEGRATSTDKRLFVDIASTINLYETGEPI